MYYRESTSKNLLKRNFILLVFVKCGYLSYGSTSCQVNYCRKSMGASQTFRESKFHDKIQSSRANMFAMYRETVWGALNQSVTMEMAS